ncbi:hypothetical protein LTR99_003283 [Exophiala xenobiotica]|uniref:Aspergillus nuclease S(1) n=1 Tax=Vermiconidia calcicola TaxID=1690605 RepID=A0AAV9QDP4_9PEZI|nr:hypothetical protein LTR92_009451 [Exophiala xenobiotica]KAK5538950.1 hypothetical protein LTR25_004494 [Vermiconidia calcicola]KAK5540480.1 hypothetical protein LTR23_006162 [Chaetothyriales sp. CCFEE 6169]KAK5217889.1 hypothetical protein LTR72_009060 [Exophiala xenobiotica]KAK5266561.1 hypothetical protein LTR96_008408 [Exophiala xenobiotica]
MLFTMLFTFALLPLPLASAWGSLGHRTVAYLASLYFTPESNVFTNTLLNGQDISEAALFPDKVRHMPAFAYTAGWHYIDAQDDPPHQCGINITRDCLPKDGGCVVSAIANHTARVANASLPRFYRGQSLRFMMHFFGDVHQPLHTESFDRGGNDLPVLFDHHTTNLHSVWDTLIPNKHAGPDTITQSDSINSLRSNADDELLAAFRWAQRLYANDTRPLSEECLSDAADCSLSWASEANAYVCSYVLAHDVHGRELGGDYFDGAVAIVDDMVGKAGRRLAAWINAITENMSFAEIGELSVMHVLETQ